MTIEEMSNEFDVLYNNISSDQAPGLNEYEKSVLLTKAQNEVVKNYFNPKGNKYTEGFDGNQKRQIDFSSIVRTTKLELLDEDPKIDSRGLVYKFPAGLLCVINESFVDDESVRYSIVPLSFEEYQRVLMKPYAYPPKKCIWRLISEPTEGGTGTGWFIIKDGSSSVLKRRQALKYTNYTSKPVTVSMTFIAKATGIGEAPVIEETDNEVTITMSVPLGNGAYASAYWGRYVRDNEEIKKYLYFDFPNLTAADMGDNSSVTCSFTAGVAGASNKVELVGRTNGLPELGRYMCRYVKKPRPIILVDLDVDDYTVSIDGETKAQSCELPEELHPEVLQRAVELAKTAYEGDLKTAIETGQRSE